MAGYKGYSMSNNAVSAYENGEKPLSRWTKAAIMDALDIECARGYLPQEALEAAKKMTAAELKNLVLRRSSWHHTSKMYNRTVFYEVDSDSLLHYLGYHWAVICSTPDGDKVGQWDSANPDAFHRDFISTDGTVYERKTVRFLRTTFIK